MLADAPVQVRKFGGTQVNALFRVEQQVAALVFDGSGLNIRAGAVGRGVHVCDQADDRRVFLAGNGAVDVAVLIHIGVGNAHGVHFLDQRCAEQLLLCGGGAGFGVLIGLGVKGNIMQEAFRYSHFDSP